MSCKDAVHYAFALAKWTRAGKPIRDETQVQRYLAVCQSCDAYRDGRCADCRCRVNSGPALTNKIRMATEDCPRGKWVATLQPPASSLLKRIRKAREFGLARAAERRKPLPFPPNPTECYDVTLLPVTTPPVPGKIDVVFSLSNGSRFNDCELRYALRSLEKYAADLGRVWVIGHRPPWLTGVIHIPHRAKHANKDADIINKLLVACRNGVTERFIFASDDQLLLAPVKLADMPALYTGWPKFKSKWEMRLKATLVYLQSIGAAEPKHFDTHVFQPQGRAELMVAVESAPYDTKRGFTVNTLILNQSPSVPSRHIGHSKLTLYKSYRDERKIRAWMIGKTHLGYHDKGATFALWEALQGRFPEQSRYEAAPAKWAEAGLHIDRTGAIWRGDSRALLLPVEINAIIEAVPEKGKLLEVGTYHGLSASLVAAARPDITVLSVDPRADGMWQKNRRDNMRLLVGTVDDLLAMNAGPFDAMFIDGNHQYGPCLKDLQASERLLKPDGALMVHDYEPVPGTHVTGKAGVRRAVDEFCAAEARKVVRTAGSVAFIQRMVVGAIEKAEGATA